MWWNVASWKFVHHWYRAESFEIYSQVCYDTARGKGREYKSGRMLSIAAVIFLKLEMIDGGRAPVYFRNIH